MARLPAELVTKLRPAYAGATVCVTGGAGFIGSHLVDTLHGLGAAVSVIDDLSTGALDNIDELIELEPDRIRFILGSLLDDGALREAVANASTVFHLGAVGSVVRSIEDPQRSWEVNATGTMRVLEAAKYARARRVVLASSSSVYGGHGAGDGPSSESHAPDPRSPYAASKLAAEQLCRVWSRTYGLDTACLRLFNIFGARQRADSGYAAVIPAFITSVLDGKPPEIFGGGHRSRDFTHVDNAVAGMLLAGASKAPLEGAPINIGCSRRITLDDLASWVIEFAERGPAMSPRHAPARAGDVEHSLADIARAKELLGYSPHVDARDGLRQTIAWWQSKRDTSDSGGRA